MTAEGHEHLVGVHGRDPRRPARPPRLGRAVGRRPDGRGPGLVALRPAAEVDVTVDLVRALQSSTDRLQAYRRADPSGAPRDAARCRYSAPMSDNEQHLGNARARLPDRTPAPGTLRRHVRPAGARVRTGLLRGRASARTTTGAPPREVGRPVVARSARGGRRRASGKPLGPDDAPAADVRQSLTSERSTYCRMPPLR
ncbi:hypothetical protein NKG05_26920 [Oerskovia sp. M15]